MGGGNSKPINALGFLSVVADESARRIGGLLVLNASGRPLEFHCTTPVAPNRAQEILYGTTLEEYLCGEQIGHALYAEIKTDTRLLLTDMPQVLALRHLIEQPIIYVDKPPDSATAPRPSADERIIEGLPQLAVVARHHCLLGARFEYEDDLNHAGEFLDTLAPTIDLLEPFTRIHDAIAEAHGSRKRTAA